MASPTLPPNGRQHCECCGRMPDDNLRVRYDAELKKHLCSWCWFSTPSEEPQPRR